MRNLPFQAATLDRAFYRRDPDTVARELIGKALLRNIGGQWLGGWIVETEAYLASDDAASHSARGLTKSNASMFGLPGTLYVYPIHAKFCLNAVTEEEQVGSAVLIRSIEPKWGVQAMEENRGFTDRRRLTRGPAMLCQALRVDRSLDGTDLVEGDEITIADFDSDIRDARTISTSRIGISKAIDLQLRYILQGNVYVSGPRRDHQPKPD